MTKFLNIDLDTNLNGENASDQLVSSQKAVKTYVDGKVANVLPSQSGNNGKVLITDGSSTSWNTVGNSGDIIPFATSTSAADATEKEVSIPTITSLKVGQLILVQPTITSTVANSTIKLNDFTAYPMRYGAAAITTSTDSVVWTANYPALWRFDGTYWQFISHGLDNNTTYSVFSNIVDAGKYTAGIGTYAITRYSIIAQKADMTWEKITATTSTYSTGTSKSVNTRGFILNQLKYYGTTAILANGALSAASVMYNSAASIDLRYSTNCGAVTTGGVWGEGAYIYLVGTIGSDGLFYFDTTKWWTSVLPSSNDGKLYIRIGHTLKTTSNNVDYFYTMAFYSDRPIFYHNGTKLCEYKIADNKQDALVSGTNIKTINSTSLLGSGDISITGLPSQTSQSGKYLTTNGTTASWASIPNTLPSQTGHSGEFLTTNGTDASWSGVDYENLVNKPSTTQASTVTLATVATSGSYNDLTNRPTIPTTTSSVTSGSTAALTSGGAYTNLVTSVAAGTTANKINVTKAGSTSTITVDNVANATTASKLGSTTVGGTTTPIYLNNGTPTALNYTIAKSVPSDAKFTDTTYSSGTGITVDSSNNINHSNSVTAGTAGTSSATSGSTLSVPYVTYDAQGHVTASGTHTHTITGFLTSSDIDQTYDGTSTNAQSGVAVKSAIDSAISSVYKPAGSVAFASLPTLSSSIKGNVYNVTDSFTTTSDFVEGAGHTYPAGTNVVCINTTGSTYKWDVLAGFVDLSGYQTLLSSSNKLNADYISDGTTNKTVTATEKSTWSGKQDALVSGTNIKTINSTSLLGSGDITITGLPSQTSQSGKYLTTNGTTASWADVPTEIPSQTGNSGKYLTTNGTVVSWATVDTLPSQSGNSGKYLTTNGTAASWGEISEYTENEVETLWDSITPSTITLTFSASMYNIYTFTIDGVEYDAYYSPHNIDLLEGTHTLSAEGEGNVFTINDTSMGDLSNCTFTISGTTVTFTNSTYTYTGTTSDTFYINASYSGGGGVH